jgi:3-isopropylmalate/(R)-2-methylmalate dehydratase small subunit
VTAVRRAGVKVVIAKSFARIYFRNAVNGGLLPIACPEAAGALEAGETAEVDLIVHTIRGESGTYQFPPLSPSILRILEAGGLIPMLRRQLSSEAEAGAQGGD